MKTGDLLTQDSLRAINSNATYTGTLPLNADKIQDSIGNNGVVYSHRASGELLFTCKLQVGIFGGGKLNVDMLVNGSWSNIYSKKFGWYTDETVNVKSQGEGCYRIYSAENFQFSAIPWSIYCGQVSNLQRGHFLCIFDDFKTSANKIQGLITASLCNSQRVGTY